MPVIHVVAIDAETHARALERWLAAARRSLSLVDVTSFVVMERLGVTRAFAYDDDFTAAGFGTE